MVSPGFGQTYQPLPVELALAILSDPIYIYMGQFVVLEGEVVQQALRRFSQPCLKYLSRAGSRRCVALCSSTVALPV